MRPRFVTVPVVVALLCAAGCSLITSYDGYSGGSAPAGDGPEAGAEAGAEGGPVVDAALSPEQTLCLPDIPANPGGNKQTLNPVSSTTYFGVVSNLRFFAEDGGCPLGKNLDGLDTCFHDAGQACGAPPNAMANCDGPGGIDNAAGPLLVDNPLMGDKIDLVDQLAVDLPLQRSGFLLSLSAWGGSDDLNDPQVNVALYSDVGVALDGGVDAGTIIDQASLEHSMAVTQATKAWVTNGVLVAQFDGIDSTGQTQKLPVHFHVFLNNDPTMPSSVTIPLSYASIIGIPVIDPKTGWLTMNDAQLVGRLEIPDLVTGLAAIYGCLDDSAAPIVCSLPDLPSLPSDDGTKATCNALSVGFGFDLAGTSLAGSGSAVAAIDFCGMNDKTVDPNLCQPLPVVDGGADATADAAPTGDDD